MVKSSMNQIETNDVNDDPEVSRVERSSSRQSPDHIVELNDGRHLLVEIKGQEGDAAIKKAAAERWCRAVSNDGRFGKWSYHLCFGALELKVALDELER